MQLPWWQISHFFKGKVSEWYCRKRLIKKKKEENATFDFNDQIPEEMRRNNMTFNPLRTTDLLQFNFLAQCCWRDEFERIH